MSQPSLTDYSLEMPQAMWLSKQTGLLGSITVVFIAARLWHLTSYGLFGDEVFTLWASAQGWRGMFSWVVEDVVHPPLFYALLKVWIDIGGQSLLWIKMLPALLSILSVIPFLLLCREFRINAAATALSLWLMAVNGFLINHAQESRMYSLLLLLVLTSLWLFARLAGLGHKARRLEVALGVVNLLLVFTHYFGWVVVGLELMLLLICRRDQVLRFSIATTLIAICFSPWAYLVITAARANPSRATFFWNRPPQLSELVGYYANLNGPLSYRWRIFGTAAVMLVFLSPIIARCVESLKSRRARVEAQPFWILMLVAFGPVAFAFVASHLLPQPVWAFRYLIIAAPAYLLAVSIAAEGLRRTRVGLAFVSLIALWAGVSGFAEMTHRDRISWEPLVDQMIQAERASSNRSETEVVSPVPVFVGDPNVGNTIQFYLDKAGEAGLRVSAVVDLRSPAADHEWVALIRYNHETGRPLQDSLVAAGYRVGDVIEARAAGHRALLFPVWRR